MSASHTNATFQTLSLWLYDVWGNELDGFDVNDRCCHNRDLTNGEAYDIPARSEDAERCLLELVEAGPSVRIDWTQSGDGTYELVHSQTGKPIGQIVAGA